MYYYLELCESEETILELCEREETILELFRSMA